MKRTVLSRSLDTWEKSFAEMCEVVLRSPAALEPAGRALTVAMRAKNLAGRAWHRGLGVIGLTTRRDHERTMHALNEIQSKLLDLEERLPDREAPSS